VLLGGDDGVFSPRMADGMSLIKAVAFKMGILTDILATPSSMLEWPRLSVHS
jgi:hypothetical protein